MTKKPRKGHTKEYLDFLVNKWISILCLDVFIVKTGFEDDKYFDKIGLKDCSACITRSPDTKVAYIAFRKNNSKLYKSYLHNEVFKSIEHSVIHELLHLIVMPLMIPTKELNKEMEDTIAWLTNVLQKQLGEKS